MQIPSFGEKASKKYFFFFSLIVYILKNFSQIFADMSAGLSDNKVIFTHEKKMYQKIDLNGKNASQIFGKNNKQRMQ